MKLTIKRIFNVKVCAVLAVILWKCHFIIATRPISSRIINVCENVADYLFIQDIQDCTKYIVCVNGQAKYQQCRSGLYFDAIQQACIASRQGCLQCPSGRMINIPLAKTCDKYISCYYGQVLVRRCENNQQFNAKTGKCDFAKNVDCVENRCSIYATETDLMYVASAASCENYYVCLAGETKLLTCAEGLYFNTRCNCCDESENVQCLAKGFETPPDKIKQKRYNNLKPTPTLVDETNKIKCPSKGHFLYQYIEDPHYYFTCANGKASLYACASGFQFDDNLKRCASKEMEEQLNTNMFEVNNTAVEVNHCPEFGTQRMPHVKDNKYILCVSGKATVFDCPTGHYFDITDNVCRANLVNQREKGPSFSDEYEFSVAQPSVKCPIKGNITLPHVQRNRYHLCIEGKASVFSCARGLYYDANLKSCTKNASSVYNSEIYSPIHGSDIASITCPIFGLFKFPHLDKTKFYLCIDGKTYILTCAQNEIFDDDINTCRINDALELAANNIINMTNNSNSTVATETASNIICPKLGTYMFPHAQRNRYYVCVDGNSIGFTCGEGYIFDAKTNNCQRDLSLADSNENQIPVILYESVHIVCPSIGAMKFAHKKKNKFYLCVNGMGSVLACAEGSFFEAETGTCRRTFELKKLVSETSADTTETDNKSSVECPISGTFIYPHIEQNLYYVCLEGKSIVFTCPKGLIFDTDKKTCGDPIQNEYIENQTPMILDEINITCPASGIHKISHDEKSKFYLCINGTATSHQCTEGDFFDAETQTCRETLFIENEGYQTTLNSIDLKANDI